MVEDQMILNFVFENLLVYNLNLETSLRVN